MPNPSYVPRSYVVNADVLDYGKKFTIGWKGGGDDADSDRLAASQVQHAIAFRINQWLLAHGATLGEAADLMGLKEARLGRLLRGETVMRLEDVTKASRTLRLSFDFKISVG
jgi:hypothetical protein